MTTLHKKSYVRNLVFCGIILTVHCLIKIERNRVPKHGKTYELYFTDRDSRRLNCVYANTDSYECLYN